MYRPLSIFKMTGELMTPDEKIYKSGFENYLKAMENLSTEKVADLTLVMCSDIHFVDPFNDVVGLIKVQAIFQHMYRKLTDPRFIIRHAALDLNSSEPTGLIRWQMKGKLRSSNRSWPIEGMSEVRFAIDGRVREHIDHWDSGTQFFERLPVIGWIIRLIKSGMRTA